MSEPAEDRFDGVLMTIAQQCESGITEVQFARMRRNECPRLNLLASSYPASFLFEHASLTQFILYRTVNYLGINFKHFMSLVSFSFLFFLVVKLHVKKAKPILWRCSLKSLEAMGTQREEGDLSCLFYFR